MAARIVLAEDNGQLAQALSRLLTGQGHDVVIASTGLQALQALAAASTGLLVLDLRLPELGGIDLLQKLRRSPMGRDLPVMIITGVFKGAQYAEAARRLGVNHYLEKPFTQKAFSDAVSQLLGGGEAAPRQNLLYILGEIHRKRSTGILALGNGPAMVVVSGEPVAFQPAGVGAFLSFLVSRGVVQEDDVRRYELSGRERQHFCRAGIVTSDELQEESRAFLARTLLDGVKANSPSRFTAGPVDADPPCTPLSLPQFLYETLHEGTSSSAAESFLSRGADRYPVRTDGFYAVANLIPCRQEDIDLLARMDGHHTLAQLCGDAAGRAASFFRYLHAFGMVELSPAPADPAPPPFAIKAEYNRPLDDAPVVDDTLVGFDDVVEEMAEEEPLVGDERMGSPLSREEIGVEQTLQRELAAMQGKNYYELFDLSGHTFSFEALKSAYFARSREYSPERFLEMSGSALELAQEILAAYANAYNTLSNVVSKERYDEMLNADTAVGLDGRRDDHLQASIQFQSGQVFLEMGEFDNAEKALNDAYTLEPDNPAHSAYLAWAIYRNPANASSRTAQERARSLLARSLQNDKNADAFAFRGWMLLDEGRDGLAEGDFQKALRVNPRNGLARKGLARITEKREAEKKGLFRKFFG